MVDHTVSWSAYASGSAGGWVFRSCFLDEMETVPTLQRYNATVEGIQAFNIKT